MRKLLLFLLLCLGLMGFAYADNTGKSALDYLHLNQPSDTLLAADQAFVMTSSIQGNRVKLNWQIAPGHLLYQSKLQFSLVKAPHAVLGKVSLPPGFVRDDPFFGKQIMYAHELQVSIPIYGKLAQGAALQVSYQGCSNDICYAPQIHLVKLNTLKPLPLSQSSQLTRDLMHQPLLWILLSLFGIGILLTFTPCVLPMLPILVSIIVGQKNRKATRGLALSLSYVLGMAIMYAIIGLVIARLGAGLQAWIQSPPVLVVFALFFVLLALSMFGLFNIALPKALQNLIMRAYQREGGGGCIQAFIMGIIATAVLSPCTSAPLIGVIGFVLQTGNMLLGALALFVLALGMGVPLIIVGVGGAKFLPRAGAWMNQVKALLGVILLLVAVWLLSRFMPMNYILILAGAIGIFYAIYLGLFQGHYQTWGKRLKLSIAIIVLVYGVTLIVGGLKGNTNPLRPLANLQQIDNRVFNRFIHVTTLDELQHQLAIARQHQQPVMVDFYADWCPDCQKIAAFTLQDKRVIKALANVYLIKVDFTHATPEIKRIAKQYGILGVPTIQFFNADGEVQPQLTLVGDVSATTLLTRLLALHSP